MTVASEFMDVFGTEPQVALSAPGRVNLLGEHTDYNDGFVLPLAIPQVTTVALGFADGPEHVAYSANLDRMERFFATGPLNGFARYVGGCLRVLTEAGITIPPLKIWVRSEVPIGIGLSSSAALEIATLRALDALLALSLGPVQMAQLAQRAEIEHAGVACGIMDQLASSLCDTKAMLFLDTRSLDFRLVPLPEGAEILVVDSGLSRALATSAYNMRRDECLAAARILRLASLRDVADIAMVEALPEPIRRRARHVVSENARVLAALEADAPTFGALMNASHASLRDDYEVSVPGVDRLVAALQAIKGVFGARMTGAGFGGACVALVERGHAAAIGRSLTDSTRMAGERTSRVVVPMTVPSA
jgi:galactokinase